VPRSVLALAAFLGLAAAGLAEPAEPSSARRAELVHLLRQDCGSCHGLTLKGGLGPSLLPEALAGKSDADLVATILDGRPGTPMPPWSFEISAAEAEWLVGLLREGDLDAR
jgi:cytochrome c55X